MDNVNPITREEKILSGEDLQPRTRMEYFLKKASENGGESGLPEYTSADKGKVLTIGDDAEHSVSETIIEEQTFTTDGTSSAKATLTVDFTYEQASAYASEETDVIVVLDGNNIPTKFEWGVYGEQNRPMIYITDTAFIVWNGIAVNARQLSKNTTYTISVIRSIPAVEPKWETASGGGSSLPSYTSADKGKFLGLGDSGESETVVIVPEQSVTLEESGMGVWVKLFEEGSGVDFSFFENAKEGDTAVFTLNGTTAESVAANVYGEVLFPVGDYYVGHASMFEGTGVAALGEPTVKTITISGDSVKPKTVAKWVTPVFVLEKNFGASTVGESEEDYNALMSAYNEGAILLLKNTASNVGALRNVGAAFYINYDSENNVFTANIAWLEDGSVVYLAFGTYTIDPNATTNRRTKMCSVELSTV